MALPGAPAPAPAAASLPPPPPPTVLMAVRAGLARPSRLPPLPAAALRLHLSVEPAAGGQRRFRLGLRQPEAAGSGNVDEYDLKDISYRVQSPTCHELRVPGCSSDEPLVLHFEEEREAQKWWSIVSSSLREVQKASDSTLPAQPSLLPAAAGGVSAEQDPEADLSSELSEKEDLALHLAQAIENGDEEVASRCAVALARQQATLSILWKESNYPTEDIGMKVVVEDATSSASITIPVRAHTTIAALKQQVFRDYGFHPLVQRWIIGQCLCLDERTVSSYGIRGDGDTAFLYLLSARMTELTEQRYEEDQARVMLSDADTDSQGRRYNTLPNMSPKKGWGNEASRKMDTGEIRRHLDALQLGDPAGQPAASSLPSPVQAGWSCPKCTFINKPTRPGCEMCSTDRPEDYVVPGGYQPDERERRRLQQEQEGIRQYQQGRREDGSAAHCLRGSGSLDDFIHLSSEF